MTGVLFGVSVGMSVLILSACSGSGESGQGATAGRAIVIASGGRAEGGNPGSGNVGGVARGGTNASGGAVSNSTGARSSTAGGIGGASGTAGAGGVALPACELLDDERAPFVEFQRTEVPAAAAIGGAIAAGTYFLTDATYHGGEHPKTSCLLSGIHEVLRFTTSSDRAGIMHSSLVFMFSDGSGRSQHPSETTYAIDGSRLVGRYTCWEPYDWAEAYTATEKQIRFIRGPFDASDCDKGVTLVLTYDKQP